MPINIGGGISIGGNVKVTLELPSLVIPTNDSGGLTGWSPVSAGIPYSATVIATYPVGSTITFQDGSTSTIDTWDPYAPNYIDIFWVGSKTGTIFPITLSV
jgi:hypothetical protein